MYGVWDYFFGGAKANGIRERQSMDLGWREGMGWASMCYVTIRCNAMRCMNGVECGVVWCGMVWYIWGVNRDCTHGDMAVAVGKMDGRRHRGRRKVSGRLM